MILPWRQKLDTHEGRSGRWGRPLWSIVLFTACIGCTLQLAAQDIDPPVFNRIDVVSEPRGAEVYLGDSLLGRTPLRIKTGNAKQVRLYYPSRRSWNAQEGRLILPLPEAGKGVAMVRFEKHVQLRSLPHGARVLRGDSLLGVTPLMISADAGSLRIEALGYEGVDWDPVSTTRSEFLVVLRSVPDLQPPPQVRIQNRVLRLPAADILTAGAVSLAAGIAAVILKQDADGYYDDYLLSGDASLLSQTKKYDIYAGISLALMQMGLGYIIYRLFDE